MNTTTAALVCTAFIFHAMRAPAAPEIPFTIEAGQSAGCVMDYAVLWGHGWIKPQQPTPEGCRKWIGAAPINSYDWTRVGIRIVTASNGTVRINFSLNTGIEIPEQSRVPVEIREIMIGEDHFAGTNHFIFKTTAGRPVTVQFLARIKSGESYTPIVPLPSSGTPAHKAILLFQRGINLGNSLEAPPGADWAVEFDATDFNAIKAEGFDHIRIPCAWHHHMGSAPEFNITPAFFRKVDAMVQLARERKLAAIINWHHFDEFKADPNSNLPLFHAGWDQISARYNNADGTIAFELLNEPHDAAGGTALNRIYEGTIRVIRRNAPETTIFVGPGNWNSAAELELLRLPATESNLIVTVHDYAPFLFTHQGASWTYPQTATTNLVFPGPPPTPTEPAMSYTEKDDWIARWLHGYNTLPTEWNPSGVSAINVNLRMARAWEKHSGRPVHIGEWGCIASAPPDSRRRYFAVVARLLREHGLAWSVWDWKTNFRYWNPETRTPIPGLREALFPTDGRFSAPDQADVRSAGIISESSTQAPDVAP